VRMRRRRGHIENHLVPHLGGIKLTELRATHINAMYRAIRVANDKRQADRLRILQLQVLREEAHTRWKGRVALRRRSTPRSAQGYLAPQ
jgi:hypothetical protein